MTILFMIGSAAGLQAHTTPTLVVEADFQQTRAFRLQVNLDPRLFLSHDPASIPPVAASWWFEQDAQSQNKSLQLATKYLADKITFHVGDTLIPAHWEIVPIDSATVAPLLPASGEVHLLATHAGSLGETPGEFKVSLRRENPVGLILLNSLEGNHERRPQAVFPGETSRGFVLPAPPVPTPRLVAEGWKIDGRWLLTLLLALGALVWVLRISLRRTVPPSPRE